MDMTDRIPDFDENGLLPIGDYEVTLTELRGSILVHGPRDRLRYPNWDAGWRRWLVDQLELMVKQLWTVHIDEIYLNGSFVEDKDHPNDIDGYFVCDRSEYLSGRLTSALNRLDPQKVWTWDHNLRRPFPGYPKNNFQCGMCIGWNSIRTFLDLVLVFGINLETSLSFLQRFDSVVGTQRQRE
jgi:hypothetical protein